MHTSSCVLRRALVLAAMLPLVLVAVALAQPGGIGPGGIPRPPFGPGGAGGIPRPPFGPGGAGGIPMPPIGPGGAGMPGGGFPGGRLPGIGERWEFTCSNCKKTVTTGMSQFSAEHIASCPHCGTRFNNTSAGNAANRLDDAMDRMDDMRRRTEGWNTRANLPGRGMPAGGAPGADQGFAPGPTEPQMGPASPFSSVPFAPPPSTPTSRRSVVILVVFVVGGILLLLLLAGLGAVIWMVSSAPRMSPAPREARRPARRDSYRSV